MIRVLQRSIDIGRWDCIVTWRAVTGREGAIFPDAPLHVVTRWARKDRVSLAGHPEIQEAIGYAQGELRARGIAGSRGPGSCAAPARLAVQAAGAGL